jgi:hypothetical protein
MPTLPYEVVQAMHRLQLPETTYDHIEFGGWIIQRLYEDESGEFEVVASLVCARVSVSPDRHA